MYPVMTWSEFTPDMGQVFTVNGHYAKCEKHSVIHVCDIKKIHNNYDKIDISTLFWNRTKVYFMCIKPL